MAAAIPSLNCHLSFASILLPNFETIILVPSNYNPIKSTKFRAFGPPSKSCALQPNCSFALGDNSSSETAQAALSMLRFYKREISPILPRSCLYVPTCSEYSMEAYKRYGVLKGTILTAWRLCRCNPLGGYGYDPPDGLMSPDCARK